MAGYDGYSRSNNAVIAEQELRFPITRAVKILAKSAGVTRKIAREYLLEAGSCEYHHTSKFYNVTDYYDVKAALSRINAKDAIDKLEAVDYESRITAAIQSAPYYSSALRAMALNKILAEIAIEVGYTSELVRNVYYYGALNDCWD